MNCFKIDVKSHWSFSSYCLASACLGAMLWTVRLCWIGVDLFQPTWVESLLLLSPMVIVPLGLRLVVLDDLSARATWTWRAAIWLQLPAACILMAAYVLPAGTDAALLTLPWLIVTVLVAWHGVERLCARGIRPVWELCVDAGLIYLVVGGGAMVLSRLDVRPFDFKPIIVLLTAVHFHYAGFALPLMTGMAARNTGGVVARCACYGVIAGSPLLAVGIIMTQLRSVSWLECFAATFLSLGCWCTAWFHFRLAIKRSVSFTPFSPTFVVRTGWMIAALSLLGSMVLATRYGMRAYAGTSWLVIPWMQALHGTVNALGFCLCGLTAWSCFRSQANKVSGTNGTAVDFCTMNHRPDEETATRIPNRTQGHRLNATPYLSTSGAIRS